MRRPTWSVGSNRFRHNTGFTLIELLAVLMLAGLLLAVTPPLISSAMPGVELKGTTRTLVSALRQTRRQAIGDARPHGLTIDLPGREMRVPGHSRAVPIPERIDLELTVADSRHTSDGLASIRFFPDGSSSGGRIILSRGDLSYRVDVDWLTGKVTVAD